MIVLPPIEITDSILTSSSVLEPSGNDPAAWSGASSYIVGDTVFLDSTHKIYEAVAVIPTGGESPSLSVTRAVPKWTEIGYTNKWAMFDLYRSTPTLFSTFPSTIVLTPGVAVDSLAILDVNKVSGISITCTYFDGTDDIVFFSRFVDMVSRVVQGWYDYFFTPFGYKKVLLIFNIPNSYPDMKITIDISGIEGMSIGACLVGNNEYLGSVQNGANIQALNFSRTPRDIFGEIQLVPRRSIPRLNCTLAIDSRRLRVVQNIKRAIDATPVLWSGLDNQEDHPYFQPLIILGIYKEFSFQLDDHIQPRVTLELEEI